MADALSLLFELDTDPAKAIAGFRRARVEFAREIESIRKLVTQTFTFPPIKLPTSSSTSGSGSSKQADDHVKEFRRIEAEAAKSAKAQEAEQRRLNSAVQSLQRQRSAALIRGFKDEEKAAAASAKAQERAAQQASRAVVKAFRGVGPGLQSIGRTLSIGITAPLVALGLASLKSAKDIDANVNTLRAFTGSAEAAEARLAQLIQTSRKTPGLTTNLALTLDAQLRTAKVTEETINRVLPAIGRLNAVSKLPDAGRFTQNLLQLITQNFEKQDLKELVGQSPLAGQLITQIFNVDSPTNAAAIRKQAQKLGLTSVDAFINAFADAAAKNEGLAKVTESIGTRFDKLVNRVEIALRPLGLAIINAIEPFIEPVAQLIERISAAFDSLSPPIKTAIIVIAGIAAVAGPLLFILGGIATAIAGVVTAVGTIAAAVTAIGLPVILAAIGALIIVIGRTVAILALLGLAWKTNFLNIRGLVADAASAVLDAFNRIKTVIEDAAQRILPTLQSITTKVLAIVTAAWERYGKDVVRAVSIAFETVVRITELLVRELGNIIDLVLKLINGDWHGAWQAFARIVVDAVEAFAQAFNNVGPILLKGIQRLFQIMLQQRTAFVVIGTRLGVLLITGLVSQIIRSYQDVRSAMEKMFLRAAEGLNMTVLVAVAVGRFLQALNKAAKEGVASAADEEERGLARIRLNPDGSLKTTTPKASVSPGGSGATKGADTETRRRIRLMELEADRAEVIARQGISAENILFDQRRTSLKDFTNFQIHEEELVLAKKKAVFAAERAEAEKLTKGRDLALGEIHNKELKADLEFADRKNQILANQQREELEATKAHRQALLDIQEQADSAEIARLEDFQRQGKVTFSDIVRRQAETDAAAFARRKKELQTQLDEAGANLEERKRITDELNKLNDEAAESVRRNERLKREAVQETALAYRDYALAIHDALESTKAAIRDAAAIALDRLSSRALLTQRQRIERQFDLNKQALIAEKRALALQIDLEEHEAIEKAKRAGALGEEILRIEKIFNERRLVESKRFQQEKAKLEEDKKADLERANSNSTRSLFGDTFAEFGEAIRSSANKAGEAVSSLQVILGGFGAAAAEHFTNASTQAGNFISILLDGIDQINAGLADMLQNWVLTGDTGSAALRKLLASTLAYYARTFLIKALDNVGEGFSNLAKASAAAASGNIPASILYHDAAIKNFISAAKYGLAAAGAAGAGRLAAGDSFKQKDTASRAVRGGADAEPRNQTFNLGGQGPVESSSQAAREGSGGFLGRVIDRIEAIQQQNLDVQRQQQLHNAQVAQALSKLSTARPGDVVTMGAQDAAQAIGVAVIGHSNSSGDFNEALQRNLGFA